MADETPDPAKANLVRLLAMRTALLCHAYAQVRKGTIHRMSTGEYESHHRVGGLSLRGRLAADDTGEALGAGAADQRRRVRGTGDGDEALACSRRCRRFRPTSSTSTRRIRAS